MQDIYPEDVFDLMCRVEEMDAMIRHLTGQIEELIRYNVEIRSERDTYKEYYEAAQNIKLQEVERQYDREKQNRKYSDILKPYIGTQWDDTEKNAMRQYYDEWAKQHERRQQQEEYELGKYIINKIKP